MLAIALRLACRVDKIHVKGVVNDEYPAHVTPEPVANIGRTEQQWRSVRATAKARQV